MKQLMFLFLCFLLIFSVSLKADVQQLEPIVVMATRNDSIIENYPGSVQVITRQDIENMPADDISDLLKTISGVEVYKRGNQNYDIDLRGFNNGGGNGTRMLLLINGIPAKNGDSGRLDWYNISIDEIERIEIIRGNAGAIYGDGAISGVINIITSDEKLSSKSSFKLNYGNYNKSGAFLELTRKIMNGFYSIKAGYETSDGFREKDEYEKKNFKFTIANFYDNTKLKANVSYGLGNQSYPGALKKEEIQKYGETYKGKYVTVQDFKLLIVNGEIKHFYNPTTDLNLCLGYKDRYYSYDKNYGVVSKNKVYNLFIKMHKQIPIKENLLTDIFSGIDLAEESISSKDVEVNNKSAGFYINENFNLFKRIIIAGSYRYDQLEKLYAGKSKYKKLYKMDSYSIGALVKIYKLNSIYIKHSKSFRTPTRDEIVKYENTGPPLFAITNISLYDIKPEKAENYEIGARTDPLYFINFDVSLFYMNVENEILFNGSNNTNFKEIAHRGIESLLTITPLKLAKIDIGYTYQNIFFAEGVYKNKIVPLSPKHRLSTGISIYPIKGLSILHLTRWRDTCYAANDLNNELPKLKRYSVTDLKMTYKQEKFKFSFNVYNLYNEKYSEYGAVGVDFSTFTKYIGYYPSPRRNYELSVSLYF